MELNPNLSENARRDAVLIIAACSGDESAFEQLMKRYKDALYFMILKMVNNKTEAEDLTVEAFGKAFSNIRLYEPHIAFSTWLFRIASNNTIDHLRKRRLLIVPIEPVVGSNVSVGIEYNYNMITDHDSPEDIFIREQNEKYLLNAVLSLKQRYSI